MPQWITCLSNHREWSQRNGIYRRNLCRKHRYANDRERQAVVENQFPYLSVNCKNELTNLPKKAAM
jgi:hypothetical protein